MADENLNQRLDRIEARLAETLTHAELTRELESVATNIADLRTELRTGMAALSADLQALRTDNQATTAMLRPLVEAPSRWPDLFAALTDRVRKIEDGRG